MKFIVGHSVSKASHRSGCIGSDFGYLKILGDARFTLAPLRWALMFLDQDRNFRLSYLHVLVGPSCDPDPASQPRPWDKPAHRGGGFRMETEEPAFSRFDFRIPPLFPDLNRMFGLRMSLDFKFQSEFGQGNHEDKKGFDPENAARRGFQPKDFVM